MRQLQLTITMDDSGRISVAGCIEDKAAAYALLELGRDAVCEFHQKKAESRIELPPAGVVLR